MSWDTTNIFTVDYGKQLSDTVLYINWKYLDALEKAAKDDAVERGCVSVRMMDIQKHWNKEIADTCREMMMHMSQTVNAFQKYASDAMEVASPKIIMNRDVTP